MELKGYKNSKEGGGGRWTEEKTREREWQRNPEVERSDAVPDQGSLGNTDPDPDPDPAFR